MPDAPARLAHTFFTAHRRRFHKPQTSDCGELFQQWVALMSLHFKSLDSQHLLTVGSEGGDAVGGWAGVGKKGGRQALFFLVPPCQRCLLAALPQGSGGHGTHSGSSTPAPPPRVRGQQRAGAGAGMQRVAESPSTPS